MDEVRRYSLLELARNICQNYAERRADERALLLWHVANCSYAEAENALIEAERELEQEFFDAEFARLDMHWVLPGLMLDSLMKNKAYRAKFLTIMEELEAMYRAAKL